MKCKVCGAELLLQDMMYMCQSCHEKFSIPSGYESNDVFIASLENDFQGRRTKESIVSQDIYYKLKNAKITTFYQRISAEGIAGESLEAICDFVASDAKIIVIIGASKDSFAWVIERYKNCFDGKKILPVYIDMEVYDLPNELKSLQALNYNLVGSVNDLTKIILHELNRDNEYDVLDLLEQQRSKRKNIVLVSVIFAILLIIAGVGCYVFGTENVLPSKKYEAAMNCIDNGKYTEAIEKLVSISDYEDSSEQLKKIYNKYNGYYYDDKSGVGLYIFITDNLKITIEITKKLQNDTLKISENALIGGSFATIHYVDNRNNKGSIIINFLNNKIELIVNDDNNIFGDTIKFEVSNKTDKPQFTEITSEMIYEWLNTSDLTDEDIISQGYEIKFECSILDSGDPSVAEYRIANTDIKLFLSKYESPFAMEGLLTEKRVFAISAPAEIITPEILGKTIDPYFKNDISFAPAYVMNGKSFVGYLPQKDLIIEESTMINCSSKTIASETYWKWVNQVYHQ